MTVSGSIYFLGKYRPAHFEANTIESVAAIMFEAIRNVADAELRLWLFFHIEQGRDLIYPKSTCSAWSADHCDRGVAFAMRPHDPFLDRVTAEMPACPGLDYSGVCNAS